MSQRYDKCPLVNCMYSGQRCSRSVRCTWLEYEIRVGRYSVD